MNQVNFSLIPFNQSTAPNIEIAGKILRYQNDLKIEYILTGELETIIIPSLKTEGDRFLELWEHTCFEFFLAIKDTLEYWEFNLSPAADWNVFHFPSYRYSIVEEANFSSLPAKIIRDKNCLKIALEVKLANIVSSNINLEVGVTAVIEEQKQLSYWALQHSSSEADFHDRASFTIAL